MNKRHCGINLSDVLEAQGLSTQQGESTDRSHIPFNREVELYPAGQELKSLHSQKLPASLQQLRGQACQ